MTECDAGAGCMLKNRANASNCLVYEHDNELNSCGATTLWLNYRGGGSSVWIGNGGGLGCLGNLYSSVLSANNYTVSPKYTASLNNGGGWANASAVFRHDATLPISDAWYPLLSQSVCNGSYQFQIGWFGCWPDEWVVYERKNSNRWRFAGYDGSFLSKIICTQTICFC
jgi:hypothetical protein